MHVLVMALSFSRRPAIVWSQREDQVSWLAGSPATIAPSSAWAGSRR
jgi:hypothetical protein